MHVSKAKSKQEPRTFLLNLLHRGFFYFIFDFWISGFLDFWIFGFLDFWIFG